MAWRFHGRARIDPYNALACATCDSCGFRYSHCDLKWQYEYRGDNLENTNFLVCQTCLDIPYQGNRPIRIPPDPAPLLNARPENFAVEEGPTPLTPTWNSEGLLWG